MKRSLPSLGPCLVLLGLAASFASAVDSAPSPAQPGKAEQAAPEVIWGPWCVTFSKPENSTQAKLMSKMRLQEAERSAQREADLEAIFADRALLDSRDLSPITKAAAAKDVKKLWLFFDLASIADQGVKGGGKVSAQQSFNRLVFAQVREALASIPGHAVLLGDEVELLSSDPAAGKLRAGVLRRLGELGSMEAIQQIARFIADPRNPAAPTPAHGPLLPPGLMSRPNFFPACQALQEALGEKSPLRNEITGHPKRGIDVEGNDVEFLQAWWKSDAARPWREWTYGDGMPLLNP